MSSLFIKSRSKSQAVLAKAGVSCLIVERVGWDVDAMKISSKPINLTCSGTLIPFSCKATEELINQGCKNIAILSRNKSLSVNRQRLKGYLDALKDHHLEAKEELQIFVDANQANYEGARQIINQLIKKGVTFDDLVAYDVD